MVALVVPHAAGRRLSLLGGLVVILFIAIAAPACSPAARPPSATGPSAAGSPTVGSASATLDFGMPRATGSPSSDSGATPTAAPSAASEGIKVGQPAPDFTLSTLDGGQIRLSDLGGKTVLINFWATWCPPCREEMPALDDLYRKRRDQGLVVLAVNFGEDPDTVGGFVKKGGYSFPVALDRATKVADSYQAVALPTSYLIDSHGVVRDRIVGAMTAEIMRAKADRFAGAGDPSPPQPGSVVQAAGEANGRVVATIGDKRITMEDVNHRVDVLLALDRLDTGAVLDPLRPADQAEIKQRRQQALDGLIDENLLADAARGSGLRPNSASVEHALVTLASDTGNSDLLAAELAKHGVTIDDVRALLEEESLSGVYVDQFITADANDTSLEDAVRRWLNAERSRRGVTVLEKLDG